MLSGHGDDIFKYPGIRINFSSNVYNHFNHEGLKRHLADSLDKINNYPEPAPVSLEKELAKQLNLKPEQVMASNGATEAIYLIAQVFLGANTFTLEPTFTEYTDACMMHNHKVTHLFQMPLSTYGFDLMWICNPNNPTGSVIPQDTLTDFIQDNKHTVFVIDASYAPFTDQPVISPEEAVEFNNVIMLHSMTKLFAIPGLRLGFATANSNLIDKLKAKRMPWSVNAMAIEAGHYLMNHKDILSFDIDEIIKERKRTEKALNDTGVVTTLPSHSHILLCKLKKGKASKLKDYLAKQHGILIRDASNFIGLSDKHFRIAIQTPPENDELIKAICQ